MKEKTDYKEKIDLFFTKNVALISCYFLDVTFLLVHTFYLIFFALHRPTAMLYISILSVACYLVLPILVKLHKIYLFINIVYVEVVFYYTSFFILFGWGYGVEIIFIALSICTFTAGYLTEKLLKKKFYPVLRTLFASGICIFFSHSILFYVPLYLRTEEVIITEYDRFILTSVHTTLTCALGIVFLFLLTNHARTLSNQMYEESITDRLTGIYNRRGFLKKFNNISKEDYCNYIVTIFDIDNFKKFNDSYGHQCGDKVLQDISAHLMDYLDKSRDLYCRWGGEEFVMVTKVRNTPEFTRGYIDDFRKLIDAAVFRCGGLELHVSITQGSKIYQNYGDIEKWIDEADNNLYIGKSSGKNRTVMD